MNSKIVFKTLMPIAVMALLFTSLALVAQAAPNTTCPGSGGGIECPSSKPFLCGGVCVGSLPVQPQDPDPNNYTLDCDTCQWVCYGGAVSCNGLCRASQAGQTCDWSDAADTDDGKKDACGSCASCNTPTYLDCRDVSRGCARPDEFTTCVGANCNTTTGECNSGFAKDSCGRCVSNVYTPVYLNYYEPQTGNVAISGNLRTSNGDLYLSSTKAIRVDGLGQTALNIGNWDANGEGVQLGVWGSLRVGDLKNYWQTGTAEVSINGSPAKIAVLSAVSADGQFPIGAIANGVAILSTENSGSDPFIDLVDGNDSSESLNLRYNRASRTTSLTGSGKYFIDGPIYLWGGEYISAGKEEGNWGLNLGVNGVDRMTIASGGNVGIDTGTVAPASRLTVFGNAQFGDEKNYWKFENTPLTVNGQTITVALARGNSGDGQWPLGAIANGVAVLAEGAGSSPFLIFVNKNNMENAFTLGYNPTSKNALFTGADSYSFDNKISLGGGGEYIYSPRDGNDPDRWSLKFFTGFNNAMTIANSGNVGIGTSQPQQKLDVNGAIRLAGQAQETDQALYNINGELYWNGSKLGSGQGGSDWVKVGNNLVYTGGNVGIGTTNPTSGLEVSGQIAVKAVNGTGDGWDYSSFVLDSTDNSKWGLVHRQAESSPQLQHSLNIEYNSPGGFSYNRMLTIMPPTKDLSGLSPLTIMGNGDVLMPNRVAIARLNLGSNSSDAAPSITGNVGALSFLTNNQQRMMVDLGGNVGIGLDNPGQKLDVSGVIRAQENGAARIIAEGKGNGWDYANILLKGDTGSGPNGGNTWSLSHRQASDSGSEYKDALIVEYNDSSNNSHDMIWVQAPIIGMESGLRPFMIKSNGDIHMSMNLSVGGKVDSSNISITGKSGGDNPELRMNMSGDNYWALYGDKNGQGDFRIWNQTIPGDKNALVVKQNTGNVGIGVTSPTQKLDIAGNLKVQVNTASAAPAACSAAEEGTIKYVRVGNAGHYYGCARTSATALSWRRLE
ncbi:MAG: hypothetical protein WC518_00350 [Patescibacteria group bacterium]